MRKILALFGVCLLALALPASAQMTVSGSHLQDAAGALIGDATIYFTPVNNAGRALSFRAAGVNGGQVMSAPVTANVSNGTFSVTLPDTSATSPLNVCFRVRVTDNLTGASLLGAGYDCVQPSSTSAQATWCTNSTCNFDAFQPDTAALAVVTPGSPGAPGPAGAKGDKGDPGTVTLSGSNGDFAVGGTLSASSIAGNYTRVLGFGDSIERGAGVSSERPGDAPKAWWYKLLNVFGGNGQNYAVGGSTAGDMSLVAGQHSHPAVFGNPLVITNTSTNDINLCGGSAGCLQNFTEAYKFTILQSLIPDSAKVYATSCTTQGFVADSGTPGYMYATSSGATWSCTLQASSTRLYVCHTDRNGTNGTSTVTIDGAAQAPIQFFSRSGTGFDSLGAANTCDEYTTTIGTHTVSGSVTITAGFAELAWVGAPYPAADGILQPPAYYALGTPWGAGNNSGDVGAAYDSTIRSLVSTLYGQGYPVYFVSQRTGTNTRNSNVATPLNSGADYTGGLEGNVNCVAGNAGALHPGECGHQHYFENVMAAITPVASSYQATALWGGYQGSIDGWESASDVNACIADVSQNCPAQTVLAVRNSAGIPYLKVQSATHRSLLYDDGNTQIDATGGTSTISGSGASGAVILNGNAGGTALLVRGAVGGANLMSVSSANGGTVAAPNFAGAFTGSFTGAIATVGSPAAAGWQLFGDGNTIQVDAATSGRTVIVNGSNGGFAFVSRAALNGANLFSVNTDGSLSAPLLKAASGVYGLCIDANGRITSSSTACAGGSGGGSGGGSTGAGSFTDSGVALTATTTGSASYQNVANLLAPNLAAGQRVCYSFGKDATTANNSAAYCFYYAADGNASNAFEVYAGRSGIITSTDFNGNTMNKGVLSAAGFVGNLHTPASSSEACTAGAFTDDANYHYVCVATNTWKRAALSAF